MLTLFVVGRRATGKSWAITELIGEGHGVVVIAETEGDLKHHRTRSPKATVLSLEDACGCTTTAAHMVALDNVVFKADDPLLARDWGCELLIVTLSHPEASPLGAHLVLLCTYPGAASAQSMKKRRSTYAFQLAANHMRQGHSILPLNVSERAPESWSHVVSEKFKWRQATVDEMRVITG